MKAEINSVRALHQGWRSKMVFNVATVLVAVSALHGSPRCSFVRGPVAQVPSAGGLFRAPFGTGRMLPVVACASKEAQAADLKLQVAALKESVAAKERERLLTPAGPSRAQIVAAMAAEIRAAESDIAAKEQAIVELIGVQVRYSAVGRMREQQAKGRAAGGQGAAPDAISTMPTSSLIARSAAGAVLLGSGLIWILGLG